MAFDHDDTDAIYEKAIKFVLTRNNVNSIIVNRREDNRDINHQIIEQLDRADFCIDRMFKIFPTARLDPRIRVFLGRGSRDRIR